MMRSMLSGAVRAALDAAARRIRDKQPSSAQLYTLYRDLPIDGRTVLFESYLGVRISCSPYAIFKAMLADPRFAGFTFVWALDDQDPENRIFREHSSLPNVVFHARNSPEYLKHLATAKYLVSNKTFYQYFAKRPEQVYLATWHGTTLKTLGKHQYGSMGQYHNVARNIMQTDYLVMPNRFTADILLESCDVRSLFPGVVVDAGQPRSDLTLNADPAAVKRELVDLLGIDPHKAVVLYAPTWRGEVGGSRDISDDIARNIEQLSARLPERFQLLLKVHDKTYAFTRDNPALQHIPNVPDWYETNELLAGVDVLITDYSSIFFDFLCLNRPIIHYVFDRAEYERTRGLYFDMETEMAGPLCETAEEVIAALSRIDEITREYRERHTRLLERFSYHEDGHASERVIDIVFEGGACAFTYRTEDADVPRVAVRLGELGPERMGAIAALASLDLDAVQVVVFVDGPPSKRDEYYLTKLDPRIKVLYRVTASERWGALAAVTETMAAGDIGDAQRAAARDAATAWRQEFLGDVRFDAALDLSGELSPWSLMFAFTPFERRVFVAPDAGTGADTAMLARVVGDLVTWAPPRDATAFSAGLRSDVAHLVAGIEYCVSCEASQLDPYCETADLLFEFRAGGLDPIGLEDDAELAGAVAGLDAALASEFERREETAHEAAAGLAALLGIERGAM